LALENTDILGVRITCTDQDGLLQAMTDRLQAAPDVRPFIFGYANTYVLNLAWADPDYRAKLNGFDLVYADGFGAVLAGRILGRCRLVKLTGADWVDRAFAALAEKKARVFILAGKPGVADRAGRYYEEKYPGFTLAGTADGYISNENVDSMLERIADARPDLLFVGMGTNRQEHWIAMHADRLPVKICWAVGGLFDYAAGELRRAPKWMRDIQLEWFWRLLVDPAGTWRRYLLGTPLFIWRVLGAWFRERILGRYPKSH